MNLITTIRQRIARKTLLENHNSLVRNRKAFNLDTAKYVGILYHLEDENTYKIIEDFLKALTDYNLKTKVACITDQKIIPHYFIPKLSQDILTAKDVNWKFQPVKPFVKDFLDEEFDILIDLSLTEHLPLLHLASNSKANMKIGKYDETHQLYYDLMIELPADASLEYFIKQVIFYLSKINTDS